MKLLFFFSLKIRWERINSTVLRRTGWSNSFQANMLSGSILRQMWLELGLRFENTPLIWSWKLTHGRTTSLVRFHLFSKKKKTITLFLEELNYSFLKNLTEMINQALL